MPIVAKWRARSPGRSFASYSNRFGGKACFGHRHVVPTRDSDIFEKIEVFRRKTSFLKNRKNGVPWASAGRENPGIQLREAVV